MDSTRSSAQGTSAALDYGQLAPVHRRRNTLRVATGISAVILLAVVALWTPRSIQHIKRSYWASQCLNFFPPDGEVCHESSVSSASEVTIDIAKIPPCWTTFYSTLSPTGFRSSGTIFLHSRQSRSGNDRLVAIDVVASDTHAISRGFFFHARVFDCSAFTQSAKLVKDMDLATGNSVEAFTPYRELKVYSAKPDPFDKTHFTIEMDLDGVHRIEEGFLADDDTIELILRP